ncbi:unnamed protein product [Caenorhabditis brenneri]
MDLRDWFDLALTSKRNEKIVRLARIKAENPRIEICQDGCIKFSPVENGTYHGKSFRKPKKWKLMTEEDMKSWLNEPNSSVIENAVELYQKLQNIFVFRKKVRDLSFCTDLGERGTIQEFLSNPVMKR